MAESTKRLSHRDHDSPAVHSHWGRHESASLIRLTDVWRVPAQLPLAWQLLRAAFRDPRAFRSAAFAVRRHRALQKPLELCDYLSFLRTRGIVRAMEIGTLWGGTFYAHCAIAAPQAHLIAVDAFPHEHGPSMTARFRRLARASQTVTCIWADSHAESTARDVAAALRGEHLDLLFLDGDHTFEGVERDYEMYSPLVRDGGIIALHDISAHVDGGVPAFWRTLRAQHEHVEFIDRVHPPYGLGIGAIVKRS
jgi:predicted O-methyltransferase YrrM